MTKSREEIIHEMCMEWDHDFRLTRYKGQSPLFKEMADLYDHCIAPLLSPPVPTGPTVRVRAACVVSADGEYILHGWKVTGQPDGEQLIEAAEKHVDDDFGIDATYFIEATLPLPVVPPPGGRRGGGDWMKNKLAALASIEHCREIIGNMPNGFSDGEELDEEIESGSPADACQFQAGLLWRELDAMQRIVNGGAVTP